MSPQRRRERGQSLVEFALVAMPLLLILLGIIQFGFIFNAYVTVANAAREGARAGSIFVADPNASQSANDGARQSDVSAAVADTLGLLDPADATTVVTYWNTDSECERGSGTDSDPRRKGHYVCVTVTYDLELMVPLFGTQLDVPARSEMVIN